MMGYAARARATGEHKSRSYEVRRWTAFEWAVSASTKQAKRDMSDRGQHLERAAKIMEDKLLDICPRLDPEVALGPVNGQPQLCFKLVVRAASELAARETASYQIARALTVKVSTGRTGFRPVALTPPWGVWKITRRCRGDA